MRKTLLKPGDVLKSPRCGAGGAPTKPEELMRSITLALVSAVAIGAVGCAAVHHPLHPNSAASLHGRRLATTARPPTPFFAPIPAKGTVAAGGAVVGAVAGGAVGAAHQRPVTGAAVGAAGGALLGGAVVAGKMSEAGAHIVRENAITDPAVDLARKLSGDFQRRHGVALSQPALYITTDDPKEITAAHPTADLVLDVSVDNWALEPFPRDPSKYRVRYAAHLRLIDGKVVHAIDSKKGLVIAHGTCRYLPEDASGAATYDQLLADHAQRLKDALEVAARFCTQELGSKVLTAGESR